MERCYNRGCGRTFDPEKNTDGEYFYKNFLEFKKNYIKNLYLKKMCFFPESCCHHPGEPYFHDAYKGWSCCEKKSVDFTEFLNIKGCTYSKHSNIKPPEPEKSEKNENDKNVVVEVRAPIRKPMQRPPIETPMTIVKPTIAQALKDTIDSLKVKTGKIKEDGDLVSE